jgi:hypothetical protein
MYKILGSDQQEYGPVTAEQLSQWVAEGRANAQSLVKPEQGGEWRPMGSYPEFARALENAPVPRAFDPVLPGENNPGSAPEIPNYLVQSILVTICCCLPIGIVAVIFAAQVNTKLQRGDVEGAMRASQNARLWCWIGLIAGLITTVVYLFLYGRGEIPQ